MILSIQKVTSLMNFFLASEVSSLTFYDGWLRSSSEMSFIMCLITHMAFLSKAKSRKFFWASSKKG